MDDSFLTNNLSCDLLLPPSDIQGSHNVLHEVSNTLGIALPGSHTKNAKCRRLPLTGYGANESKGGVIGSKRDWLSYLGLKRDC